MRVLHEDEVQHIFPEDNEEELQVGDVVNALWLPNDQYYDAKVLQKGGKQRFSLFLIIEIFPDKLIQPLIKRRVPPTVLIKHCHYFPWLQIFISLMMIPATATSIYIFYRKD